MRREISGFRKEQMGLGRDMLWAGDEGQEIKSALAVQGVMTRGNQTWACRGRETPCRQKWSPDLKL